MKSSFRLLAGLVLALFSVVAARAAATLEIVGVAAAPGSAQPGQNVQFTVSINNTAIAPTGGGTANDFSGGTADVAITLTSLTADPIVLGSQPVSIPAIPAAGAAAVLVSFQIPTKYSQAASYFITAEVGFRPTSPATATAVLNGRVIAINMVDSSGVISMGSNYPSVPAVTISGGGGSGAAATAILAGGAVIAIDITNPGSGYTSAPTVTIAANPNAPGTGTNALATAVIGGPVNSITGLSSGSGYSSAPRIKFVGGAGGNYASGSPSLNGSPLSSIAVTSPGSGYASPPTVTISGGGGTGATATAAITGTVGALTLLTPGTGYSPSTAVGIVGGGGTGAAASATINGSLTSLSITTPGSGYTVAPTVSITGGGGTGATATLSINGTGNISGFTIVTPGTGYTSAPTVTLSGGGGGTGGAVTANVTGPIVGLTLSTPGTGYSSPPTITITDAGGTGATATAAITAVISSITPGALGSGYTSPPTVSITGGGGTGGAAVASLSGSTGSVAITNGGSDYTTAPTVVFSGGGPTSVGNGRFVVSTYTPATATFTVTGKPDLLITGVNYPAGVAYKGGDVIPMSLTFTNTQFSNGTQNVPFRPQGGGVSYFRIQVVLSSNPTYGDADDFLLTFLDVPTTVNADNVPHTFSWNQLLPGNFAGSYYVLARIDSLKQVDESIENDPAQNGNNDWLDVAGTRIALLPTTFPTMYLASAATTGSSGNGYSDNPSITSDGRYTAFASDAANLVTASAVGGADTNNVRDIFIFDSQTGTTRRLNLSQQGAQANAGSANPAISAAGRYVAFSSDATNLILGDTNGFSDIFVVDVVTGAISLQSLASNLPAGGLGPQANGSSFKPSISSDGRYLVFESSATNLVGAATTVGVTHIYLRDRDADGNGVFDETKPGGMTTVLVSQSSAGVAGNGNSIQGVISGDGKYVAFASNASNLVAGDTNGLRDVFLRDLAAGTTIRVSVGPAGVQSVTSPIGGDSRSPSINSDGRYIAFSSEAPNLVTGDTNGIADIFVYDRVAATTSRVSISTAGTQATDPAGNPFLLGSINPNISETGRFVTFASMASNLAPGDSVGRYGTLAAATIGVGPSPVTGLTITNPGIASGSAYYTSVPGVTISGGGGSGATAHVTLSNTNGTGYISAIVLDTPGSGYTTAPTVTITGSFNAALNIYVADRDVSASGTYGTAGNIATTLVSVNKFGYQTVRILGVQSTAAADIYPVISADGRWVAMPSDAETNVGLATTTTNLLSNDSNGARDVFLHDRRINALPATGSPPTVTITNPGNGTTALVNTPISITASATAARVNGTIIGVVSSVQFFVNGTSVGTTSVFPYSANWTPTAVGTYTLSALVTDSFGNRDHQGRLLRRR
ncbi:MAG: Ig-like domain-containing protein [Verrucomicrobia bacterium]|nr:Ig-like domain-containing protein [Verrucomicrobiota bacterium]